MSQNIYNLPSNLHSKCSSGCLFSLFMWWQWHFMLFNWLTDHRILDRNLELKGENLALTVENEKLRNGLGVGDSAAQARIQVLEKKLLDKQEELTDMHKRKGDNQQMIIDLNVKVTELQKQLDEKNNRWVISIEANFDLLLNCKFISVLERLEFFLDSEFFVCERSNWCACAAPSSFCQAFLCWFICS